MIIEEALISLLKDTAGVTAIAGTRGYPLQIPQDAALPAYAYQRISGPREATQEGASGFALARIQIGCQAETYAEAKALKEAIRLAVDGYQGTMGGGVTVFGCYVENELDGMPGVNEARVVYIDVLIEYLDVPLGD